MKLSKSCSVSIQNTFFQDQEYERAFLNILQIGVIPVKNGIMFVIPKSEVSKKFFQEEQAEKDRLYMVGVFIGQEDAHIVMAKFAGNPESL